MGATEMNQTWILRQGERELFRFVAMSEVWLRHAQRQSRKKMERYRR
jgi:hypothetical protein